MVISEQPQNRKKFDRLLWVIILLLTSAGVAANYYFINTSWALRLSGWIILACLLLFLGHKTISGEKLWRFAREARIELRKVVWPTREETVRTTMIVAAMVVIVALILWGIDTILLGLINWLSGR